jgi:50S ribosomal subunit-associated GTPase HflX
MVKAMGGREDPRVTSLRAEHREGLKGVRRYIEKARADVRAALLQEPFEEHALRLALSELRKHSNKAQKRAQDDMVHLALRMTPAERNELRKLPPLPKRKPRPKKD